MQPLPHRRLSAVLVRMGGSLVLLDCGEGTQVAVRERAWGLRNLSTILLTHMHADHVLGLPGLLLTLAHAGKEADEPITIYGPEPLLSVLQGLLVVAPYLTYPVHPVVLSGGETFTPPGAPGMQVRCLRLDHDVPCLAYSLAVPRAPRFDPDRARALHIPVAEWRRLQQGHSVIIDGREIPPSAVLGPPRPGVRLVLATDTVSTPELTAFVHDGGQGADLLITDAMYPDEEAKPKRWEAQHLTFAEAATLARDGQAKRLWLTHFGPALSDPVAHLDKATALFPATVVGYDGMTEVLSFENGS